MTLIIDVSGMGNLGVTCYGGLEEYEAKLQGKDPPPNFYRPRIGNIAPRTDGWGPARGNTQTPPRSGPAKNLKPAQSQPRAPAFGPEIRKVLPDM